MPAFKTTEELHYVMQSLWQRIKADEVISRQLLMSKLIVQFKYSDPVGQLTIDGRDGHELKVFVGECVLKADVEMSMRSEVANEFWLGRLNVPMALITGRISSKGPVHKALALLPAVKPAFSLYPSVIEECKGNAA
jgi:hypothetical protein